MSLIENRDEILFAIRYALLNESYDITESTKPHGITENTLKYILKYKLINEKNYIHILNESLNDPIFGERIQLIIMAMCEGKRLPLTEYMSNFIHNYRIN